MSAARTASAWVLATLAGVAAAQALSKLSDELLRADVVMSSPRFLLIAPLVLIALFAGTMSGFVVGAAQVTVVPASGWSGRLAWVIATGIGWWVAMIVGFVLAALVNLSYEWPLGWVGVTFAAAIGGAVSGVLLTALQARTVAGDRWGGSAPAG